MHKKCFHLHIAATIATSFFQIPCIQADGTGTVMNAKKRQEKFSKLVNVVTALDYKGLQDYIISNIKDIKAYINEKNSSTDSILKTAITSQKNDKTIELLIKAGADLHRSDAIVGDTPLHLAVKLMKTPIMELLVKYGADINAKNKKNRTPLDLAVEHNNVAFIKFLIFAAGKSATADTIKQASAYAKEKGYKNIEKMLEKYLAYKEEKIGAKELKDFCNDMPFI